MLAQFSIIPLDGGDSLSADVARIVGLVRASGLEWKLGPMGTTVEGEPERVFALLYDCHMLAREHSARVYTTIAIDDRGEASGGRIDSKVKSVEDLL